MAEVREGIYLEVKQSTVGTGDTASRTTFRNFYAVCLLGESVVMHLLDDRLGLTGLKETVTLAGFPNQLTYQPKLDPYYDRLKPSLAPPPPPQARPEAAAPAVRPQAAPPQIRPEAKPPQVRPEAKPPQTRPPAQPPAQQKDSPWWEMTSRGSDNLLKKK
ncbi:MAG: hypothetical protein V1797_10555 [Pseudomonadota bacterium]